MGHNIDFRTAFSLSWLKCPYGDCDSDIDMEFEELDIDCGVNQMETGLLELDLAVRCLGVARHLITQLDRRHGGDS